MVSTTPACCVMTCRLLASEETGPEVKNSTEISVEKVGNVECGDAESSILNSTSVFEPVFGCSVAQGLTSTFFIMHG